MSFDSIITFFSLCIKKINDIDRKMNEVAFIKGFNQKSEVLRISISQL